MITLHKAVIIIIVSVAVVCGFSTHSLSKSVNRLSENTAALYTKVLLMEAVYDNVYKEHLNDAVKFAPKEKTMYQLRGDAQVEAQRLLNYLTTKHKLPTHNLSGIRFRGSLATGAAGQATACEEDKRVITLNEILYYRNYNEFIYEVIPHEVAHVFTCLNGGSAGDEHGPEWKSVMIDLHIVNPDDAKTHELDMNPVYSYQLDLVEAMGTMEL